MKFTITPVSSCRAKDCASRPGSHLGKVLLVALAVMAPLMAQTTTNFTATVTSRSQEGSNYTRTLVGNGAVGTLEMRS